MKKLFAVLVSIILLIFVFIFFKPFYSVPILNYHSVNYSPFRLDTPKVTPEVFEKQMAFIQRMGYRVISLDEYAQSLKLHRKLQNAVVITFDDGYDDNYFYAFPILKKYGFPAAIFIIVKHIDKSAGFLDFKQIKAMEKSSITFGSHTINHVYLPPLKNEAQLREEISGAKKILEEKLGHPIDYISYPLGGHNEHIKELVKEAGYAVAFTTNRGRDKLNRDIYALKRIKITQQDNFFTFGLKTSGYYNLFQKSVKPE